RARRLAFGALTPPFPAAACGGAELLDHPVTAGGFLDQDDRVGVLLTEDLELLALHALLRALLPPGKQVATKPRRAPHGDRCKVVARLRAAERGIDADHDPIEPIRRDHGGCGARIDPTVAERGRGV